MKTIKKKPKDINDCLIWLADYISDLPDQCPHKQMIEICKDIIKVSFETIDNQTKIIKNQTELINNQTEIINSQTKIINEFKLTQKI